MSSAEIEKRLEAVEHELSTLRTERASVKTHPVRAIEQIHGVFENDEAFQEATRLGHK
jgi:hypothetical protein